MWLGRHFFLEKSKTARKIIDFFAKSLILYDSTGKAKALKRSF
jgi:hypothetical protein